MLDTCAKAWLSIQCRMIPGIRRALVGLDPAGSGRLAVAASWPEGHQSLTDLQEMARQVLESGSPAVSQGRSDAGATAGPVLVACPIRLSGERPGVVAVEIDAPDGRQHPNAVIQLLTWGAAWLEYLLNQEAAATATRLGSVTAALAACVEPGDFHRAAQALVTRLADTLHCDRVSLGVMRRGQPEVVVMSHTATLDRRTNLVRGIENAMDEALCEGDTVCWPAAGAQPDWVGDAQATLARENGAVAILSVPLADDEKPLGGLTLERHSGSGFSAEELAVCRAVAALAGPVLALKRREDRGLPTKIRDAATQSLQRLLGPDAVWTKVSVAAGVALLAFLALSGSVYRVTADAVLEGAVHRALVAPFDSFVVETHARAGDLVSAGDVLAVLDRETLDMERRRWDSEVETLSREHRRAVAAMDRTEVGILDARIGKARARVALIDEQLAHTRVTAPLDGVVVSGDLSRSLGAPVERGQVLFEVAPMDSYQVVLHVPEHDVAELQPGQTGSLVLAAMPGKRFGFQVDQVIGVAGVQDGRNVFRVEARLDDPQALLRPGMKGVGKVDIAERRRLWVWTHQALERLDLWVWSHLP